MKKILTPLWIFGAALLFLYSYTQVDLSLTLSRASVFQDIQKAFQYVGWFDRPLSSLLYLTVFAILFFLYFLTLRYVLKREVSEKALWITIITITGILTLSYNAFSYDIFNYIFDAKIVTFYNQNPYFHKALDFPGDPMLSFMHWTHRTYPYGPVWLLLTIPLSYLGNQIFVITFFLFKILMSTSFLITALFIYKFSKLINIKNPLIPLAAFSLNPYVISESLVSSHNDIVMMGLGMAGIYFLFNKSKIKGWLFIFLSVGTKFATGFPAVVYILTRVLKKEKYFLQLTLLSMIIAVVLASFRTTYQPWYFLYIIPFASLLIYKKYIFYPVIVWSIINVLYYLPYLYFGSWDEPVPFLLSALLISGIALSLLVFFLPIIFKRK